MGLQLNISVDGNLRQVAYKTKQGKVPFHYSWNVSSKFVFNNIKNVIRDIRVLVLECSLITLKTMFGELIINVVSWTWVGQSFVGKVTNFWLFVTNLEKTKLYNTGVFISSCILWGLKIKNGTEHKSLFLK